jgi:hypothetical protein
MIDARATKPAIYERFKLSSFLEYLWILPVNSDQLEYQFHGYEQNRLHSKESSEPQMNKNHSTQQGSC